VPRARYYVSALFDNVSSTGPHSQKNLALIKLIARYRYNADYSNRVPQAAANPHYFNDTILMKCADLCDYFIREMSEIA